MLEEKDLQAIAQLMSSMENRIDQKLAEQKQDIMSETKAMLTQQRKEIMGDVKVLLDTEVQTKFNLLAENQQIIMEKLECLDDMEVMDTRITALEAMVKKLNREMEKLKKAQ